MHLSKKRAFCVCNLTMCYAHYMSKLHASIAKHKNLSEKAQVKAGKAIEGKMDKEHTQFLQKLIKLLDEKKIDTLVPESFLNKKIYDKMPQEWQGKATLALVNIVDQVRRIETFYRSKQTPDSSPQLQTMIEHLWQMKQRIEDHYDAFKL